MGLRLLVCVWPIQGGPADTPARQSALEGAMCLAETCPSALTALSPDVPGGEDALRSCLALAAGEAYLVRGGAMCALDTVSAGEMVAGAVLTLEAAKGPFDAVICADADPGQEGLGPVLAEALGRPQATGVRTAAFAGRAFQVWREWDGQSSCLRVEGPCVLSYLRPSGTAPYPTIPRLMAANRAPISALRVETVPRLHALCSFGLRHRQRRMLDGGDPHAPAALAQALRREHII